MEVFDGWGWGGGGGQVELTPSHTLNVFGQEGKRLLHAPTYIFTRPQTSPSLIPLSNEAICFQVAVVHVINRHQLDLITGVRLASNDRKSKGDGPLK